MNCVFEGAYCACKLHKLELFDDNTMEEVMSEIIAFKNIRHHPNVINFYGIIRDDEHLTIVMEYRLFISFLFKAEFFEVF